MYRRLIQTGMRNLIRGSRVGFHQVRPGCLADQLVGQWFAHILGIDYLAESEHIRKTLCVILRYNYKRSLREHSNVACIYARGDEAGLIICTWPYSDRPELPFSYLSEVFSPLYAQTEGGGKYGGTMVVLWPLFGADGMSGGADGKRNGSVLACR